MAAFPEDFSLHHYSCENFKYQFSFTLLGMSPVHYALRKNLSIKDGFRGYGILYTSTPYLFVSGWVAASQNHANI